ncbi:unnamed protein product [Choristocarpus tenellus]
MRVLMVRIRSYFALGGVRKNQECINQCLVFPVFIPGHQVLVYRPYESTDGLNPKLLQSWRGPYEVHSKVSPTMYRVVLPGKRRPFSIHLGIE